MTKLPIPPDDLLRQAFALIERMDSMNFKRNQNLEIGLNAVILTAANGSRWKLVVSNTGALSTVAA